MTYTLRVKTEKKAKKEKEEIVVPLEDLSPIAHPLAQKKLVKKLHKTIKKGTLCPAYRILDCLTKNDVRVHPMQHQNSGRSSEV